MLPLVPILLVLAVLLADGGFILELGITPAPGEHIGRIAGVSIGPAVFVVLVATLFLSVLQRQLGAGGALRPILRLGDRCMAVSRWLLLLNYLFTVLVLDALGAMRHLTGGLLLLDELLLMLPPLLGIVCLWWAWYPIERQLHETALLHRLDRGLPVHLPPGRWPYVLTQLRLHVLLMLVPMLLILGLSQSLEQVLQPEDGRVDPWVELGTGVSALLVLAASPWLARWLLGLRRLPDGSIRRDMQAICDQHRVRARDIMLWRTGGTMINAAVMGMVPQLRYLVLTDGLLEQVPRRQVQAVMAHEVGHVRHRHMIWLLICLLATLVLGQWCLELMVFMAPGLFRDPAGLGAILQLVLLLGVVFVLFGWMSKRFERQADTFAVQHLSADVEPGDRIDDEAVSAMADALMSIASLQAVDPGRRSWRHGSIAWRCSHLRTLVDQPVGGQAIDRTMLVLRGVCACIVVAGVIQLVLEVSA